MPEIKLSLKGNTWSLLTGKYMYLLHSYKYLMTDYFGTRQIIFGNNMNAIGYSCTVPLLSGIKQQRVG